MLGGVPARRFLSDLWSEISDDNVFNGAAALAFYMMLSIFPALILLLSLLPFLPIANLEKAIFDFVGQALPGSASQLVRSILRGVLDNASGGLLSFGLLFALWSASSGLSAVMQQLNVTYDVKEGRPFWKVRGIAILLTLLFGVLVVGAFALIVLGGVIQDWLAGFLGRVPVLLGVFAVFRWVVIALMLLLGLALIYYYGPDVEQEFRFISPGSVAGVVLLAVASLGFKVYVSNFASYDATYGSLGAVIVLLLWFYIAGLVILLGSEVNALVEHYSASGKQKGEKGEKRERRAA